MASVAPFREDGEIVIRELDRREGARTEALCIPQSEHAAISGQLAAAWGDAPGFAAPRPPEEVVAAASLHDVGMDDFDADPTLDPDTGLPRAFRAMPLELHLRCWRRGPERVAERAGPYAALLVSLHGCGLMERRRARAGEPEREQIDAYLSEQEELRSRLRVQAQPDEEELERNRTLLVAWDWMSLALCIPELPTSVPRVPLAGGESGGEEGFAELRLRPVQPGRVAVTPWPFADERVRVIAQGKRLRGRFSSGDQMRAALRAAPDEPLQVELVVDER